MGKPETLNVHGRPLRRPVVYLDTSTLGDAFPGAQKPNPALTAAVELAANIGTLCLSLPHVTEIAAIPDRDRSVWLARWLTGLDHHWIAEKNAEAYELEQALRIELGLSTDPIRLPVDPTLTGAIRENLVALTPSQTNQILRDPTIRGLIREAHGRLDWSRPKIFSVQHFKELHADRAHVPPGTTQEQVRDFMRVKVIINLKVSARHLLRYESIPDEEIQAAVDRLMADPLALPINRISPHLWGAIGERITDQSAESGKFEKRYGSLIWDLRHTVGGAFADVFTCDHFVDTLMGDFRTARGLQRQLSVGRDVDPQAFAAALRRQIEAAEHVPEARSA